MAVTCLVWLCPSAGSRADELPPGTGRDLVYGHCQTCHSLSYIDASSGLTRPQWSSVLDSMRQLGMPPVDDADRNMILDYLATTLGPEPSPQLTAAVPANGKTSSNGDELYRQQCAACHQRDGSGVKGQFPPLAKNPDLFLSRDYPAIVALHGLEGAINVTGASYNGSMPAFRHLSDEELLAIISYVRSAWGNADLRPEGMVAADLTLLSKARQREMTPYNVREYRASLR